MISSFILFSPIKGFILLISLIFSHFFLLIGIGILIWFIIKAKNKVKHISNHPEYISNKLFRFIGQSFTRSFDLFKTKVNTTKEKINKTLDNQLK